MALGLERKVGSWAWGLRLAVEGVGIMVEGLGPRGWGFED